MGRGRAAAADAAGVMSRICVGGTRAEGDRGEALGVVARQVQGSLPAGSSADNTVIAYEPVWAIGTGRTPTPEDVAAVPGHLRRTLDGKVTAAERMRLLYGGPVKPDNAQTLRAVAGRKSGV